ncbi:MAG: hypothetical protein CENE_01290 [Candidatus Celerinatantimonas neptuna]|nr:MAG: hypothetical protein CENE_01290 [Candidatus Celerinatantimonas neptuna]
MPYTHSFAMLLIRLGNGVDEVKQGTLLNVDATVLLGMVNERLRNQHESLKQLAIFYSVNEDNITDKLSEIGYYYDESKQQFIAENTHESFADTA